MLNKLKKWLFPTVETVKDNLIEEISDLKGKVDTMEKTTKKAAAPKKKAPVKKTAPKKDAAKKPAPKKNTKKK